MVAPVEFTEGVRATEGLGRARGRNRLLLCGHVVASDPVGCGVRRASQSLGVSRRRRAPFVYHGGEIAPNNNKNDGGLSMARPGGIHRPELGQGMCRVARLRVASVSRSMRTRPWRLTGALPCKSQGFERRCSARVAALDESLLNRVGAHRVRSIYR